MGLWARQGTCTQDVILHPYGAAPQSVLRRGNIHVAERKIEFHLRVHTAATTGQLQQKRRSWVLRPAQYSDPADLKYSNRSFSLPPETPRKSLLAF